MELPVLLMKVCCFRCQSRSTKFQQKQTEFTISLKERYGNKCISRMCLMATSEMYFVTAFIQWLDSLDWYIWGPYENSFHKLFEHGKHELFEHEQFYLALWMWHRWSVKGICEKMFFILPPVLVGSKCTYFSTTKVCSNVVQVTSYIFCSILFGGTFKFLFWGLFNIKPNSSQKVSFWKHIHTWLLKSHLCQSTGYTVTYRCLDSKL